MGSCVSSVRFYVSFFFSFFCCSICRSWVMVMRFNGADSHFWMWDGIGCDGMGWDNQIHASKGFLLKMAVEIRVMWTGFGLCWVT